MQEKVDLGELMMSLCYLPTAGRLTVTILKARNLKAMDITGTSGTVHLRTNKAGPEVAGDLRLLDLHCEMAPINLPK